MGSIYTSFGTFMKESLNEAKKIDDFGKMEVFDILMKILPAIGWKGFLALCVLLSLGNIAFGGAMLGFMTTPVGLVIAIVLGVAAAASIKKLYKNRTIPLSVRTVGNEVRPRYNTLKESQDKAGIDTLKNECARMIISEAHYRINRSIGRKKWI